MCVFVFKLCVLCIAYAGMIYIQSESLGFVVCS